MKLKVLLMMLVVCPLAMATTLESIIEGAQRSAKHSARDDSRHPLQTLQFFEVEPNHTVVEISPGGSGWYTEILAPLLRDQGKLYAAHYDPDAEYEYFKNSLKAYQTKLAASPEVYDKVELTIMQPPNKIEIGPDGSADRVLTFRNVHNWVKNGGADEAMAAFYKVLKPGGILGVVDHRAKAGASIEQMNRSGYVTEKLTVDLAEAAGFKLIAKSEINANAKDSTEHEKGVWTLPPSLRLGEQDRERYQAIGESDRMTLKFAKPE